MLKVTHIIWKMSLILSVFFSSLFFMWELSKTQKDIYTGGENHIAFVLDVSRSMNVGDMDWYSRLAVAKQKISDMMSENKGYDFALSIFAWESQRVLPFTSDKSLFVTFLRGIDSNNLTVQGTDISLALDDAIKSFGEDASWNIIILTDGDDQEISISSDTKTSLWWLWANISIIGVGTLQWWYIPNKIYNWERVKVWLNETGLKKLAKKLWGEYYSYQDTILLWDNSGIKKKNLREYGYLLLALFCWIMYLGTIFKALYYAK